MKGGSASRAASAPLDIRIVPSEDAHRAASIVCANYRTDARFRHYVRADCEECGQAIMHRPETPDHLEKLCFKCALAPFNIEPEA